MKLRLQMYVIIGMFHVRNYHVMFVAITMKFKNFILFSYLFYSFEYRIFVATWNVAGKSPPSYLSLEDWLHISPPADIYVLG
jgi:hypothetical protein